MSKLSHVRNISRIILYVLPADLHILLSMGPLSFGNVLIIQLC